MRWWCFYDEKVQCIIEGVQVGTEGVSGWGGGARSLDKDVEGIGWVFCAILKGPKLRQEFEWRGSLMSQVLNPGFRSFWEDGKWSHGGKRGRSWYSTRGESQRRQDFFCGRRGNGLEMVLGQIKTPMLNYIGFGKLQTASISEGYRGSAVLRDQPVCKWLWFSIWMHIESLRE